METSPTDALLEQAREWGSALLAASPWAAVEDRVSLILVDPPHGVDDLTPTGTLGYWLTLDQAAARSLTPEYRDELAQDRAIVQRPRVAGGHPPVVLSIVTDEAFHRLLQQTTRTAMELRWQTRHALPLHDRQRRLEQYQLRAGLLPDEAPERILRTLWLELAAAINALDVLTPIDASPADALPALGEAAAAIYRIASFDHAGAYPPSAYLRAAARNTRITRRIHTWLEDLPKAIAGDAEATRRVIAARHQVLEEVRTPLGERYRDRPWLRTPEAFTLRPPR